MADEQPQQNPAPAQPQQAAPQEQQAQPQQPANVAEQGAEAAKQAASQVAGGIQQGVSQLQNLDVKQMFKAAANQPKVTTEERMWAGISYIPLVAVVSLLSKPDSAYVKLHGRQGLLLFLIFFFCIFVYLIPWIGPLFGGLVQMGVFIAGIFSMYQAFVGNWWKIPVLGDIAEMLPVDMMTKVTTEAITGQAAPQQGPGQQPSAAAQPPQQTGEGNPPAAQS